VFYALDGIISVTEELRIYTKMVDRYAEEAVGIGANIQRLRIAAGYGKKQQGKFADAVGVLQTQVSDWENRGRIPNLENLVKLAKGLGTSIDELIEGFDHEYDRLVAARSCKAASAKPVEAGAEHEQVSLAAEEAIRVLSDAGKNADEIAQEFKNNLERARVQLQRLASRTKP
jgi:transcriptional regulator with XRE-family HTH domain